MTDSSDAGAHLKLIARAAAAIADGVTLQRVAATLTGVSRQRVHQWAQP